MSAQTRHSWLAFVFILILFVPQLPAFSLQFTRGFVPFVHEPGRVPLSWDMFSTPVERCRLEWQPPLSIPGRRLGSFAELGTRLEWDVIYDHVSDYRQTGRLFCLLGAGERVPRRMALDCFLPSGIEIRDENTCP